MKIEEYFQHILKLRHFYVMSINTCFQMPENKKKSKHEMFLKHICPCHEDLDLYHSDLNINWVHLLANTKLYTRFTGGSPKRSQVVNWKPSL